MLVLAFFFFSRAGIGLHTRHPFKVSCALRAFRTLCVSLGFRYPASYLLAPGL